MIHHFLGFLPYLFGWSAIACWYDQIRIFAHGDQSGQAAADRWTAQLGDTATVGWFSFQSLSRSDSEPVKHLNDLLKIRRRELPEECESHG
jgi:hypothetical protein